MFGSALHYATHYPKRLAGALTTDPLGLFEKLQDRIVQNWEYRAPVHRHELSANWEGRLHRWLRCEWPCAEQHAFHGLWPRTVDSVRSAGIDVGPASFAGFNDGDTALVRAIWCITRHLHPKQVVETGVAHGFTSRFILEALERNGSGQLSSIDRPPLDPATRRRVGIAVSCELRHRWDLIARSSQRCLPGLLRRLGSIDLFIHDSLHTKRNVCFELSHAWAALRPGGILVVDDVDTNAGFGSFIRKISGFQALVCEAEPVRPDERRFNGKGLFGLILKEP